MRTLPFSTAHPYELVCLVVAALAFVMTLIVFLVKISDLIEMTRTGHNGIIRFMQIDKVRNRGFIMVAVALIMNAAVSSVNNMAEPTGQALNWISTGIFVCLLFIVDGFMVYRKRLTQFILVAEHDAELDEAERAKYEKRLSDLKNG